MRPHADIVAGLRAAAAAYEEAARSAGKPATPPLLREFKEGQRLAIERHHRIVLNVGDQVSDIGLHGDTHMLLPNPFYRLA
jgi:hypothetical protein